MPPVLHVPFDELSGRGQQQLSAQQLRSAGCERHRILQLIAETECATGLIEAGACPQATRERLVQQPTIHQHVEQRIGRGDGNRVEQRVPMRTAAALATFDIEQRGARQRARCVAGAAVAEHERAFARLSRLDGQRRRDHRARVEARTDALAEFVWNHAPAGGVEQFATIAGPVVRRCIGAVSNGSRRTPCCLRSPRSRRIASRTTRSTPRRRVLLPLARCSCTPIADRSAARPSPNRSRR